jgi:alcohol dehydrogenase class IV
MFTFNSPTKLVFGTGVSATAAPELAAMGARKPLIVTGPGATAVSEGLAAIKTSLSQAGMGFAHFSGAASDPSIEAVDSGAELFAREGCDALLAYGGGSPLDCAKGIGARLAEGRSIADFIGTGLAFSKPLPPLVAVPTTAGTGSEVTSAAVFILTREGKKQKQGTAGVTLFPRLALVDPLLALPLPPGITASTGMDALTHAVEAYVSRTHNPAADLFCLEAIRLIGANLRKACRHGDDVDARSGMALASTYAGIALSQAGLGMVHGFAHAVGAKAGLAHGLANAILLPYVMKACTSDASGRLAAIGAALTGRHAASAADAVAAMAELRADLGLPSCLASAGIPEALLPELLADARTYKRRPQSPRLFTDEELGRLLQEAWSGQSA